LLLISAFLGIERAFRCFNRPILWFKLHCLLSMVIWLTYAKEFSMHQFCKDWQSWVAVCFPSLQTLWGDILWFYKSTFIAVDCSTVGYRVLDVVKCAAEWSRESDA